MTNPDNPHNQIAPGSGYTDGLLRRMLDEDGKPESDTARMVRWRTTATEAYTMLYQVYEELRETGHAFAWATAYEASGLAGMLLADLGDLLGDHQKFPPTQEATQPPTTEAPCSTTQHCAAFGWCHRCDPTAADAGRHVVKAVDRMGIPPAVAGSVYAAAMDVLRHPSRPVGERPCPGR